MEKSMLNEILEVMEINNSFEDEMAKIFLSECENYTNYEELIDGLDKGGFIPINGFIRDLIYYSQTYEIFRKHFDEIFEVINNEFEEYYGEEYNWGLDYNRLVWTAFELLTYRWHGAILTLME
jgi:hypothetical protein